MQKQIDVTELGRRAAEVVDEVVRQEEPYIVARDGEPEAVLISYIEFLRLQSATDAEVHERFQRLLGKMDRLNSGVSDEEVARDVAEAIAEVRSER
jgi:prevent-host-death family protein